MKQPVDVATAHTLSFATRFIPKGATILEIGCGEGQVAAALQKLGHPVTGIDSDAACVAQARRLGVPAFQSRWPDFDTEIIDAVLFTRSLHHIEPLDDAVKRAISILATDGILLVEDFAFHQVDEATVDWLLEVLRARPVRDLIRPESGSLVAGLLAAKIPLDEWHENHDHDLHLIDTMVEEIAKHATIKPRVSVPYLYRYLVSALPKTAEAATLLREIFMDEERQIAAGNILPVGRRVVAAPR
jgi:SAM-dependent methyltransferase